MLEPYCFTPTLHIIFLPDLIQVFLEKSFKKDYGSIFTGWMVKTTNRFAVQKKDQLPREINCLKILDKDSYFHMAQKYVEKVYNIDLLDASKETKDLLY